MTQTAIVKVIVRSPMWRDFDYLLPDSLLAHPNLVGRRVIIPFGKRQVVGIISHRLSETNIDAAKLKEVVDVLDEQSYLSPEIIKLCEWASTYYHHPLGEVMFGIVPKKLRQLRGVVPKPFQIETNAAESNPYPLSSAQQQAVTTINEIDGFGCALLHGVTGSGKTEVYLQAIAQCLEQGQQALVLVPEISLTPQTLQRFQQRFSVPIVALNSALKDSERLQNWFAIQSGEARILIGTRSAVFVPMPELGMIIVDEEHDVSFKQQSGFRYSARDVAVMRGYFESIPVVLGSATPSLESLYNAWHRDRYYYVSLPERVGSSQPPKIKILDIKKESLQSGLSSHLIAAMHHHLEEGGQVLLFLNRRGYAPVMMCHQCGFIEQCPRCDTYLTFHNQSQLLCCHHCDYAKKCARICSQCHQSDLIPVGLGTERLEQVLEQIFKEHHVLRIDRDTTRKKGALENMLADAHDNKADILIGTQMLAKGHHFNKLTLVAVVDADSGLFSADFRALERLAQLLVQVAGRSGREDKVGEVIIQTHHPDHPMLQTLLNSGYTALAKQLLEERQAAALPPHQHMALFRSEHAKESVPMTFLKELKSRLVDNQQERVEILGPIVAPMARRAGKYRAQLLIQAQDRAQLQKILARISSDTWLKRQKRQVAWSLDVDPVELV